MIPRCWAGMLQQRQTGLNTIRFFMTIRRAVRPFEISNRSLHEVRGSTERLPHRH